MVGTTALQFAQIAILANLLSPTEFGLMAMVLSVIGVGVAFADAGISNVVIARHITSRDVLSTLYWANVITGLILAGIVLAATPAIAAFFGEDELRSLLPWVALVLIAQAVGQQFQALMQRDLAFATLAKLEIASVAVGSLVAVALAVDGAGALSLVLGYAVSAAVKAAGLAVIGMRRWRLRLRFRFSELREHLGFGAYQVGERGLAAASQDLDYILIGRILGAEALGAYMLAFQLMIAPMRKLNPVITRVAFPLFARAHDDSQRLRRGYGEVLKIVALATFPILALIAALGPVLVPTIFGSGWETTVQLLAPMALVGGIRAVYNPVGALFLAKNRPELGFRLQVLFILSLAGVILATIGGGVVAVAWGYAALVAAVFALTWVVIDRLIGFPRRDLKVLWPGVAAAAAALGVVLAIRALAPDSAAAGLVLLIAAPAGIAAAGVTAWRVDRRYIGEQMQLIRAGLRGRRPPPDGFLDTV